MYSKIPERMKKIASFLEIDQGFTLIELLIVVAIIASLAVTVAVALNPVKLILDARNARRTADVDAICTAINAYITDKGALPPGLTTGMAEAQIGTGESAGACGEIFKTQQVLRPCASGNYI